MSVSSQNQFYYELGIVKGWLGIAGQEVPKRVAEAIEALYRMGMGEVSHGEAYLQKEVEAFGCLYDELHERIANLEAKQGAKKTPAEILDKQFEDIAADTTVATPPEARSATPEMPAVHQHEIAEEKPEKRASKPNSADSSAPAGPMEEAEEDTAFDEEEYFKPKKRSDYIWSDEDRKYLMDARAAGKEWGEIAGHLGRTRAACYTQHNLLKKKAAPAKEDGSSLPEGDYAKTSAERIERIREMAGKGWTDKMIADVVGHTTGYVCEIRNANGILSGREQQKLIGQRPERDPAEPRSDTPPDRLIEKHNGYAGKRDPQPNPLQDSDWPDVKLMLEKHRRSVSQIASDYDVDFDTMRAFIDKHTLPKEPGPGEARAPLPSLAGGAENGRI